ncbi:hypothetical protein LARV_00639 [Longilinea arvoryzae]|uniref:Mu-like prophage major head subunit gpT n=1 Tax=Longilinea arvoryzae TaxID=360412 RepID=A0A0S7BEG6_9CHLR|nr:hypothetical protein [Longilinea arvoryzae]GAP12899.1 hypothetical protein LARV_00639 [Longilinea arvoryzae]
MTKVIEEKHCRTRLDVSLEPENSAQGGGFEILAISAGEGNGWQFGAEALRASLPLWDGVETFIDHTPALSTRRSLRDLAGVCSQARYDESVQGVRLHLQPAGPSAALLEALGREWLQAAEPRPRLGFSADLLFSARGKQVVEILRVLSLDLVFNPARGGVFLRALNQTQIQEESMSENPNPELELCQQLLETTLSAARLPKPASDQVRKQFDGRCFTAAELNTAMEDTRRLVSDLTGGQAVQSVSAQGRVSEMFDERDQISAALHELLGAPRPEGLERLHVQRLSGIREFYTQLTGDTGFTGGRDAERAQLATTASLPGLLKDALNKLIVLHWQELGRSGYRWWEPVVSVEHFTSLQNITGVLVGEVTALPSVNEGEPYTELPISDSAETGMWNKYGGYIGLTLEMFERDETHKLRQYPRKLASAALRRISALVASVFTTAGGAGPMMADGYTAFEAAHHANLGATALSGSSWEAASQAIYDQPMLVANGGSAPKLALDARYLLVPRDLRLTGMQILYPNWERQAQIFSENLQRGELGDVITVPEFSDANNWAAAADPRLAPAIILGERFGLTPEIFIADNERSGALFTNDELRMKVRHWVSVFVADYRPLFKANVA